MIPRPAGWLRAAAKITAVAGAAAALLANGFGMRLGTGNVVAQA
jgi:hypothetical protein